MSQVMLITGTRKGIGRFLVDRYLAQGYVVAGCSRKSFDEPEPEGYHHYRVDVANEHEVVQMVRDVAKKFGTPAVLINNAGIAAMNHLLLTPLSAVQKIFSTNVFGMFVAMILDNAVEMRLDRWRIANQVRKLSAMSSRVGLSRA